MLEPKPSESLFVESIRLTENGQNETWFLFSLWLGHHLETDQLEVTAKPLYQKSLKRTKYDFIITTAKDAYAGTDEVRVFRTLFINVLLDRI